MRRLFVMSYETSVAGPTDTPSVARRPRSRQDWAVSDTGDSRSRRWAATHRRIYETAMRLFREQGFERVNIGRLAAAAEVSVPTFYAHFPSKEHVIMQLPTAEQIASLIATQPADRPLGSASSASSRSSSTGSARRSGRRRWTAGRSSRPPRRCGPAQPSSNGPPPTCWPARWAPSPVCR
jgi:hypothetical protein